MLRITFFWGRNEKQSHPVLQATCTSSPETGHVINSTEEKKEDHVFNYHKAKLTYGLLSDFGDAIREGDGQRLLSLYKLALLIFFLLWSYKVCICDSAFVGACSCHTKSI